MMSIAGHKGEKDNQTKGRTLSVPQCSFAHVPGFEIVFCANRRVSRKRNEKKSFLLYAVLFLTKGFSATSFIESVLHCWVRECHVRVTQV